MAHIFDFNDAKAYDKWLFGPENLPIVRLEQKLMMDMLAPARGRRLLDIGCGTGVRMVPFIEKGLDVTGIDPSPYMLDIGRDRLKNKMDFHRGVGEDLPFEDNAFNYVTLITALEFVEKPEKVLQEAARVAKNKIFIGFHNRYNLNCARLKVMGMFSDTIYNKARFFSIWQLKQMAKEILGNVPVTYNTVCRMLNPVEQYLDHMNLGSVIRKLPFGTFAGMLITPVPRFITTPLVLKYKPEKPIHSRVQPIKGSHSGRS